MKHANRKITRGKLKDFLAKKYNNDILADRFSKLLSTYYFDSFSIQITGQEYIRKIEKMFNEDDNTLKKFAFKIFAVNSFDQITESDLFELIKMCQGNKH